MARFWPWLEPCFTAKVFKPVSGVPSPLASGTAPSASSSWGALSLSFSASLCLSVDRRPLSSGRLFSLGSGQTVKEKRRSDRETQRGRERERKERGGEREREGGETERERQRRERERGETQKGEREERERRERAQTVKERREEEPESVHAPSTPGPSFSRYSTLYPSSEFLPYLLHREISQGAGFRVTYTGEVPSGGRRKVLDAEIGGRGEASDSRS